MGGHVNTLGSARSFGNFASGGDDPGTTCCPALVAPTNGQGLWGLSPNGHVQSLGSALDLGDLPAPAEEGAYTALAAATDGKGLWAVTLGPAGVGGHVNTLGSARSFGNFASGDDGTGTVCCTPLVAPTNGEGLWAVSANGHVRSLGRAPDLGEFPTSPGDPYASLVGTPSGRGLWAVSEGGRVRVLGDAGFFGDLSDVAPLAVSRKGLTEPDRAGAHATIRIAVPRVGS